MDINPYNNSIITIANLHNRMIKKHKAFIPNSLIFCSILCLLILPIESQDEPDIVHTTQIPQFKGLEKQNLYAGYLNLTNENQAFYYMYFQSHSNPKDDPIILWLGGGTSCSSLVGMMYTGPFVFGPQADIAKKNNHTWNTNASLLYIQSPLGVGFSKGNATFMNDTVIAQNNYQALLKFFQKYPNLKANDFYIAGQNYAGIHIVRLASLIVANNQQEAAQERKIFIKGILIGNGCTHPTQCTTAKLMSRYQVQFLYTRGFLDDSIYSLYQSQCIRSNNETSDNCTKIQQAIQQKFMSSKANIYNIYGTCYPTSNSYKDQQFMPQQQVKLGNPKAPLQCADMVGLNSLFNTNQTRKILHLQPLDNLKWVPCGGFNYNKQSRAAYNFLPSLIKYGIKVHYYSGNFDTMVPIQGTISWLKKFRNDFGVSIKRNWRPWSIDKKVFSGMVWQIDGITFWSVSGAGSMVPKDKPQSAKLILDVFLGLKQIDDFELLMGEQINQF